MNGQQDSLRGESVLCIVRLPSLPKAYSIADDENADGARKFSKQEDKRPRARYTREFKLEAVWLDKGRQDATVTAKVMGIPKARCDGVLRKGVAVKYAWIDKLKAGHADVPSACDPRKPVSTTQHPKPARGENSNGVSVFGASRNQYELAIQALRDFKETSMVQPVHGEEGKAGTPVRQSASRVRVELYAPPARHSDGTYL